MPRRLEPDFFERLFEDAGLPIFACDARGRILAYNSLAQRLCRQREIHPEDAELKALLPEGDRATFDEHLAQLIRSGRPTEFRSRIAGRDSEISEYAVWLSPRLDATGAVAGASVWFHDITARLQIRRDMRKNERLSVLGSMSGSVAHHYNNLLGGIATSLEYAMNMNTISAMRRALQRTSDAVSRGAQLTRQLLAFARADSRYVDLADLTEMVLYYFDENETRLAERGIRLQLDWLALPMVALPKEHFLNVLANLTTNAIEAMPLGGTLSVRLAPHSLTYARLTISDTGQGIPSEHMERLFEPFFTTKGELASGTMHKAGMGLAVVHGLVSEMGGTIAAANNPDHGARFEITLPLHGPRASGE